MKRILAALCCTLCLASSHSQSNSGTPQAKNRAEANGSRVELAAQYFQAGKPEIAIEEIQKVLAEDPRHSGANNLLGLIRLREGNAAESETAFRISLGADPGNAGAHNNYGMLLCQTGRHDAGMEEFGKALQRPSSIQVAQTLLNGGICLTQKGDAAGAEKFFLKALEAEPFMPSALYQLAKVYHQTNREPQAESRLAALHRQIEPTPASAFLAYQVARAQNKPEANKLAQTLRARFPDSVEAQQLSRN